MLDLYIDADACPVREEAFRVAERHGLSVVVVTCGNVRVPIHPRIRLVLVEAGSDAADDWIAEHIGAGDICVTADVPLAARCLEKGAAALGPTGRRFTADNIGSALAGRALSAHLRELGETGVGPKPLAQKDRSRFLGELDTLVNAIRRNTAK
ncbi:MAG: YaiI/YqxD family protein [Aliidongia sp.]